MEERGWGWSPSQIRLAQLIEWLAQQPAGTRLTVAGFYEALEDQSMNTSDVVLYDLGVLEAQSLINRFPGLAKIPEQQIQLTQALRDRAADLHTKRDNKGLRRRQCRDAMVDWLHALDAVSATPDMPATEQMLDDSRHGT